MMTGRNFIRALAGLRKPLFILVMLACLGGMSTTAVAGYRTAPGCESGDASNPNGGLWDVMKNHADARRVHDAANSEVHRKPDSGVLTTCFDLALSLSARLGGIFADLAGGFNLSLDLPNVSGWVDAFINFNAIVHYGRATPAFFPPKEMPPPFGALLDTAMGAANEFGANLDVGGKMNLYNPFGNLGGLRFDLAGNIDISTMLTLYWKTLEVSINANIPEFSGSIGANLGLDVATSLLADLSLLLDFSLPLLPNFSLPFLEFPDFGFLLSGMMCGSIASIGAGFDLGPLEVIMDAIIEVLNSINSLIDKVNSFLIFLNGIIGQIQAVLAIAADLVGTVSLYARMDASFAGMDLLDIHASIPIPWITPGCLFTTGIWAGKEFIKNPNAAGDILDDATGTVIDAAADPIAAAQSAKNKLQNTVEQGIAYAGPLMDMPFISYSDLVYASMTGGIASGRIEFNAALATSVNAGILAEAQVDLDASLAAPELPTARIEVWKQPPPTNGKNSTSCAVIAQMPGATVAGCLD